MDEISPIKTVRISGHRFYLELWMSRGLENSSRKKMMLYKKLSLQIILTRIILIT